MEPPECTLFSIRDHTGKFGQDLCRPCYIRKKNEEQRVNRKSQNTDRTSSGSHVPNSCLSPAGKKEKYANLTKRIKAKTLHTKRLKVSLTEARQDQLVNLGQDVTAAVKPAFDFIKDNENKSVFKKRIVDIIV